MRSWFSGSCSFSVTSSDYWAFGCPVWMPLSLRRGGGERHLSLSPLLCPGAEEFVVVSCPVNIFRITSFPLWPNDVFPHVPTIWNLLYCSLFIGCGSGGIQSAQSSSLRLLTWLEQLGGYPFVLEPGCVRRPGQRVWSLPRSLTWGWDVHYCSAAAAQKGLTLPRRGWLLCSLK